MWVVASREEQRSGQRQVYLGATMKETRNFKILRGWVVCAWLLPILFGFVISGFGEEIDRERRAGAIEIHSRLREIASQDSRVMQLLSYLSDAIGPRLTGSTQLSRASEWARERFQSWGLQNSRLEPWGHFGRGWELERLRLELVKPYYLPLIGQARAWTPGTKGIVRSRPIAVTIDDDSDFARYIGRLQDRIVLLGPPPEVSLPDTPMISRWSEDDLEEVLQLDERPRRRGRQRELRNLRRFREKVLRFIRDEGTSLLIEPAYRGFGGTLFVGAGGSPRSEGIESLPSVVLAAEHFGLLWRILSWGDQVEVEADIQTRFLVEDQQAYNVIAEIPGGHPVLAQEIVMAGAHLDSWHGATGTSDNAAGSAAVMEAARLLKAAGATPRRTIRFALWSGEEQGLLGSRAYVRSQFLNENEEGEVVEGHQNFSAYFNLDNGAGRIRGVYLQRNQQAGEVFRPIVESLKDLEVTTLSPRSTGGTDHLSFHRLGLPGFQFIQDPLSYRTLTHHSNMDFYEHVVEDDLRQASLVLAIFLLEVANLEEKVPRLQLSPPSRSNPVR